MIELESLATNFMKKCLMPLMNKWVQFREFNILKWDQLSVHE